MNTDLWSRWKNVAALPALDAALRSLYAEIDAAVAERGPTCWVSGKCCKFDDFGHRLYVTGLEIAWFLGQVEGRKSTVEGRDDGDETSGGGGGIRLPQLAEHPGACPYQVGGLCSTHQVRPLGCRVFFCQQGTEDWQHDLYERFLSQLQKLHETHGIEYRYMDWIAGLSEAAGAGRPGGG